jgi:hypothetical protein
LHQARQPVHGQPVGCARRLFSQLWRQQTDRIGCAAAELSGRAFSPPSYQATPRVAHAVTVPEPAFFELLVGSAHGFRAITVNALAQSPPPTLSPSRFL